MKYTTLFPKTQKDAPKDEVAINAQLLIRGGFIKKELAGVYNYLPLGYKVLQKVSDIVRDEMVKVGGQEILLSALQNKASWEATKRWDSFDALFKVKSRHEFEYGLGPTHEEVLVPLVASYVSSYKDLPLSLFQIQTKFRDEARAKSGILRGREFLMKDLYSFHTGEQDFEKYYASMRVAYKKVFERVGLDAIETEASGGAFSEFSHEYQVATDAGEDEIIYCPGGDFSQNTEISKVPEGKMCDLGHGPLKKVKSIEVGNIFPLKTKFSDAFGLTFTDKDGSKKPVIMGCYGIGISRLMGTIVEVHHDEKGIIWPESVAPFQVYLIGINKDASEVYNKLIEYNIDVLWDDREDKGPGEKFGDADLLGIPYRVVISEKTGEEFALKKRTETEEKLVSLEELIETVTVIS